MGVYCMYVCTATVVDFQSGARNRAGHHNFHHWCSHPNLTGLQTPPKTSKLGDISPTGAKRMSYDLLDQTSISFLATLNGEEMRTILREAGKKNCIIYEKFRLSYSRWQ